jgi:cytochrome c oxidase subunit 1
VLGLIGNPRRYADFKDFEFMGQAMSVHTFMTHAAIFTASVQVIFLVNLIWSWIKGPKATENPWEATTLEWTVSSPPPFDNFGGKHPVVNHGPYEFATPGKEKDYVMQTDPA